MGTDSAISWTDHTWNCWQGCTKVSPACENCYMFRDKVRYGQNPAVVVRSSPSTFRLPLRMARAHERHQAGVGKNPGWAPGSRVFTCSWSDFFHADADQWRPEAWEIIRATPQYTYLILTKRIERVAEVSAGMDWPGNAWLGVTAENQPLADERIPELLSLAGRFGVPAFVSIEPQLGQVDLGGHLKSTTKYHMRADVAGMIKNRSYDGLQHDDGRPMSRREAEDALLKILATGAKYIPVGQECEGWSPDSGCPGHRKRALDWVIVGGESGPGARELDLDWARSLRDQCRAAGVPFFFKQVSGLRPRDGQIPADLRIREVPGE